jgi:proline dehydrogenase
MQVTALGNPELLKQLSRSLAELTRLFGRFDRDGNGYVSKEEFFEVYKDLFVGDGSELFDRIDVQHDDRIDYVSFVDRIKLADIPAITKNCRNSGPLKAVCIYCMMHAKLVIVSSSNAAPYNKEHD